MEYGGNWIRLTLPDGGKFLIKIEDGILVIRGRGPKGEMEYREKVSPNDAKMIKQAIANAGKTNNDAEAIKILAPVLMRISAI